MPDNTREEAVLAGLGLAVRRTREQRGMSVEELAAATGTDRASIDALEMGRLDPTLDLLVAVAEELHTQPSTIVLLAEQLAKPKLV